MSPVPSVEGLKSGQGYEVEDEDEVDEAVVLVVVVAAVVVVGMEERSGRDEGMMCVCMSIRYSDSPVTWRCACAWDGAGGEPLALVSGVEKPEPDPEEEPEQHSQLLESMRVPGAIVTCMEIDLARQRVDKKVRFYVLGRAESRRVEW